MSTTTTTELQRLISDLQRVEKSAAENERAAYERGWSEALAAVEKAIGGVKIGPIQVAAIQQAAEKAAGAVEPSFRENAAPGIVFNIIKRHRAILGHEIVAAAASENTPIHERTMRTALHRLKARNLIKQDEQGRWITTFQGSLTLNADEADADTSAPVNPFSED